MKLDPGMHIGMHLVCFSKTECDTYIGLDLVDVNMYSVLVDFVFDLVSVDASFGDEKAD
jgi:hypothetical protein